MFNDPLTRRECEELVRNLAECAFPFMCAHGRPSMVPLIELGNDGLGSEETFGLGVLGTFNGEKEKAEECFADAWGKWRRSDGAGLEHECDEI